MSFSDDDDDDDDVDFGASSSTTATATATATKSKKESSTMGGGMADAFARILGQKLPEGLDPDAGPVLAKRKTKQRKSLTSGTECEAAKATRLHWWKPKTIEHKC